MKTISLLLLLSMPIGMYGSEGDFRLRLRYPITEDTQLPEGSPEESLERVIPGGENVPAASAVDLLENAGKPQMQAVCVSAEGCDSSKEEEPVTLEADDSDIATMGAIGTILMLDSVKDEKIREDIRRSLNGNAGLVGLSELRKDDEKGQQRTMQISWTVLTRTGERVEHTMTHAAV